MIYASDYRYINTEYFFGYSFDTSVNISLIRNSFEKLVIVVTNAEDLKVRPLPKQELVQIQGKDLKLWCGELVSQKYKFSMEIAFSRAQTSLFVFNLLCI